MVNRNIYSRKRRGLRRPECERAGNSVWPERMRKAALTGCEIGGGSVEMEGRKAEARLEGGCNLPLAIAIAQTFFGVFRLRFAELQIISQEFSHHKSLRKEF